MKSCGVSLVATAVASSSAAARSLSAAANDEEKMASAKASETEEDFPTLTTQEKESLLAIDRLELVWCLHFSLLLWKIPASFLVHVFYAVCNNTTRMPPQVIRNRLCCVSSTCSSLFGFHRLQEDGARTKALLLKVCHHSVTSRSPLFHYFLSLVVHIPSRDKVAATSQHHSLLMQLMLLASTCTVVNLSNFDY